MDASAVLAKTDAARALLTQRDAALARALRSFLILLDGQRSLGQLAPAMQALGVNRDMVQHLEQQGLVQRLPRSAARSQRLATPPRHTEAPTNDSSVSAASAQLAPPASDAEPAPAPPAPERSLAGAKFYALNLVTLMLAGQDAAVRAAVREATTAQQLADWLSLCASLIAEHAGAERAEVFSRKLWPDLPDELRAALPGWAPD
jgi:hypothetical protein